MDKNNCLKNFNQKKITKIPLLNVHMQIQPLSYSLCYWQIFNKKFQYNKDRDEVLLRVGHVHVYFKSPW